MPRIFIGIPVSVELEKSLHRVATELAVLNPQAQVKWTYPQNYHITLSFVGEVADAIVEALTSRLDQAMRLRPAPAGNSGADGALLKIQKVQRFPNKKSSIVSAPVTPTDLLFELHKLVSAVVEKVTGRAENRQYKPHITLGRIKAGHFEIAKELSNDLQKITSSIRGLVVYESTLTAQGPLYKKLQQYYC